jgi:phosphatidylethanolamine-binding protein (PEBP) family uncharacterized protein
MPLTTPPAQPTRSAAGPSSRVLPRGAPLAAGVLCAAALALASGCGESSGTPAAATPPTTTPPATSAPQAATSTTAAQPAATTPAASAAHHGRSALAKARARTAFQSLANAKPAPKLTPAQLAKRPISDIQLTSPTMTSATLSTANTCYGADEHPALRWKNIPAGTAEIAIAILSTKPVNNKLFYNWTITHIPPTLHEIPAGQTPPGTITATNSYGHPTYNICPPAGTQETYATIIYALPTPLHQTPGFNPTTLHTQIQHTTHHTGLLITTYHHT